MWSFFLSACQSFCEQDFWKSNESISLKLCVMVGLKNWLTFDGVPVPDTDHFSIFLIIVEQGILGDLLAFLVQSPPDCYKTWRKDWHRQATGNKSKTFWETSASRLIRRFGFESQDHLWLKFWHWQRFSLSEQSCYNLQNQSTAMLECHPNWLQTIY